MEAAPHQETLRLCKYCKTKQPDDAFEICRVVGQKVYRRHKCKRCKYVRAMERRKELREWFRDHKKNLRCQRCSFADYRALVFHHSDGQKEWNIGDMIKDGLSRESIEREVGKCTVLCANCHAILHYGDQA
jgi:hypothetical protein